MPHKFLEAQFSHALDRFSPSSTTCIPRIRSSPMPLPMHLLLLKLRLLVTPARPMTGSAIFSPTLSRWPTLEQQRQAVIVFVQLCFAPEDDQTKRTFAGVRDYVVDVVAAVLMRVWSCRVFPMV
eukprot:2908857-Amphidinium_carterae.1